MSQSYTDSNQWSFTQVADAYLEMHREGRAPSVSELAESFPHLAQEIHRRLPAMRLLEGTLGADDERYPSVRIDKPIGGCRIVEEIGRGACGIVFRAEQPELGRDVAIKAIRLRSNTTKRFEVERHAMARLNHPNIVPVYAYTQVDQQAYLIMKLIDGFSFEQLLRGDCDHHGKFLLNRIRNDWRRFAKLGRDLAAGLEHAHENNLVHRDIKPGNLMMDRTGHAWIADFGLVKLLDLSQSLSATGDLIGTPRYMSPEQLRARCDARSDIYSLGLSLKELATGEKPSQLPHEKSCPDSSPAANLIDNVPPELLAILDKASSIAPEDRYQSAAELRQVFDRFIRGKVPDRRKGRRKPDDVFRREFKTKITLAVVGAALVGALSYFVLFQSPYDFSGEGVAPQSTSSPPQPTDQTEYPLRKSESKAIATGLDEILQGIETGQLTDSDITKVVKRYRESHLSVGARIVRIAPIIAASGLSDDQKIRASETITKLARLCIYEQLDEEVSAQLVDELTEGRQVPMDDPAKLLINDNRLLRWVDVVEARIKDVDVIEKDITDDVRKIFSSLPKALKNHKPTQQPAAPISVTREGIEEVVKKLPADLRTRAIKELKERSKQ